LLGSKVCRDSRPPCHERIVLTGPTGEPCARMRHHAEPTGGPRSLIGHLGYLDNQKQWPCALQLM
jgi:hypothetical protein